jgi:hypothetical protein
MACSADMLLLNTVAGYMSIWRTVVYMNKHVDEADGEVYSHKLSSTVQSSIRPAQPCLGDPLHALSWARLLRHQENYVAPIIRLDSDSWRCLHVGCLFFNIFRV